LPAHSSIAAQLVGDKVTRHIEQTFQQLTKEALGGALVPTLLDQDIQHFSVLIHGPPQIMTLPPDCDEYLVELPRVAWAPLAMPQLLGKGRTEFQAPLPHGFITNAHSSFGQQLLDITEAEAEAMIEPHGVGNDFRRKAIAAVKGQLCAHTSSLPVTPSN
jgi:hypothetical protein